MPIVKRSLYPFAETTSRLVNAIRDAGNTVFATIDQAAAAQTASPALRPTTLIVFGNPKAGTALMQAHPLVGLDLPVKLLVWQDGDAVDVAYAPMSEVAARYGISTMEPVVRAIDANLAALADFVASPPAPRPGG
jgi:uncharacterized protein (DUF302 family)